MKFSSHHYYISAVAPKPLNSQQNVIFWENELKEVLSLALLTTFHFTNIEGVQEHIFMERKKSLPIRWSFLVWQKVWS